MKVKYDQEVDVLRIRFSSAPVEESDEEKPGTILARLSRARLRQKWEHRRHRNSECVEADRRSPFDRVCSSLGQVFLAKNELADPCAT